MDGFPTLPTLPELGHAVSSAAETAAATVVLPSAAASAALGTGGGSIAGISITKIVVILLGLLMIGAGIFSFKETRTVLLTAGKAVAAA